MTTVYHVHKCHTFTAIGFEPRVRHSYDTRFDDPQHAIDYCDTWSRTKFNPMTQDMTTEFYYIMVVKV